MSFVFSADSCLICHHLFSDDGSEKRVRVCAGREKLISSSIKRGHSDLTAYLSSSQHEINVHESCRKWYINEANVQQKRGACADEAEGKCKILRFSVGEFDWKQNCFICERMVCISEDPEKMYSTKQIQRLLQKRYSDDLFFANVCGHKNVVCFCNMAKCIVNDKWHTVNGSSYRTSFDESDQGSWWFDTW